MPTIPVYVKNDLYEKLIKDCGGDPSKVPKMIAEAVEDSYGKEREPAKRTQVRG